jgi:hypothetical protein
MINAVCRRYPVYIIPVQGCAIGFIQLGEMKSDQDLWPVGLMIQKMKQVHLLTVVLVAGNLFFISCKRQCDGCGQNNKPPYTNAGPDQTISLPTDSALLDGRASSDGDGYISSYQWSEISGPASFIIHASSATAIAKNLVTGTYQFELKVTDNGGLSTKDTMRLTVLDPGRPNRPPIANAGPDQVIAGANHTVVLDGRNSSDPDNNIIAYLWTFLSGPSTSNVTNVNSAQALVTVYIQGVYTFQLKVTDADGLYDLDTCTVTVNPAGNTHWSRLNSPPSFGTETFIMGLDAGNIFVGEGYFHRLWKYNVLADSWNQQANVPGLAYDYLVSFGVNGKGYTGMGYDLNTQHNEMYQFDPQIGSWTQKNNSPLAGHPVSMVINNRVYLINDPLVYEFDPVADFYTKKNNFPGVPGAFSSYSGFVIHDTGYVISGIKCWRYNKAADNWQQKASLPEDLNVQAGFSLDDYGYVIADSSQLTYNYNYPMQLWRYDPLKDRWSRMNENYPGAAAYLIKTFSVNGAVYVGFGYNNGDWPVGDFWKFQ